MPIKKLAEPCWESSADDEEQHYRDEAEAREWAADMQDDPAAVVTQLDKPCSYLECDGCGAVYDQEAEGYIAHIQTQRDANVTVFNSEWAVVGDKIYCLAEDCAELGEAAQSESGQVTLP